MLDYSTPSTPTTRADLQHAAEIAQARYQGASELYCICSHAGQSVAEQNKVRAVLTRLQQESQAAQAASLSFPAAYEAQRISLSCLNR